MAQSIPMAVYSLDVTGNGESATLGRQRFRQWVREFRRMDILLRDGVVHLLCVPSLLFWLWSEDSPRTSIGFFTKLLVVSSIREPVTSQAKTDIGGPPALVDR